MTSAIDASSLLLVGTMAFTSPQLQSLNRAARFHIAKYVDPGFVVAMAVIASVIRLIFSISRDSFIITAVLIVVYNFQALADEAAQSCEQNQTLERTLNQNKAAYMALLDDKNELGSQVRKLKQEAASKRSMIGSDLSKQIVSVQIELKQAKERCAALEKQAEVTRAEFVRLQQEKDTLRSQLKSFEVVFGNQRKKMD